MLPKAGLANQKKHVKHGFQPTTWLRTLGLWGYGVKILAHWPEVKSSCFLRYQANPTYVIPTEIQKQISGPTTKCKISSKTSNKHDYKMETYYKMD